MNLADSGLTRQPFQTHGKPLVLVPYASQKAALQFLEETRADDRGLGLFHGPPLSGKTTIIERFARALPVDLSVAIVDGARAEPATLLKSILSQFGYDHGFNTTTERFNMIRVVALQQAASGHAPLLVVENVHAMSPVLLEMLCELAEMTVDGKGALRIILVSDRPIRPIVEAPAMQSISSRLTGKFLLKPMTRTETATYAHKKLKSGGCENPKDVMPPPVCDRLHSASGGWPGVIDRLAMMALAKAERLPLEADLIPRKSPAVPTLNVVAGSGPHLILTCRGKTLKRIGLDRERLLIGRSELCDIDIVHEWISRQHAIVIRNGKSTIIVDLNSRNGVYVNKKRVKSQVLVNNDVISLGDHRIKFVDPAAKHRTTLRGAGWDDTTLAESIRDFRKSLGVA
jgi:type II secretory pathway predicted ATPase ExeA